MRKIILRSGQAPGDIVMLSAAVRDLKLAHSNDFQIDVRTSAGEIWENNPYLTPLNENDPEVLSVECLYPLIHRSNTSSYHFIHGYRMFLEQELQINIPATEFKGDIHLSDNEKSWMSQVEEQGIKDKFWIIMAGGKYDFTCKFWNPKWYQTVVDHFKGKITFVQCGETHHWHPPLRNVINLIGKTDLRQFIRLIYHSSGVLCPVTFAMHAAVAVPMKHPPPQNRPCVVIAGGREPAQWEAYPHHRFLATNGALDCCDNGGCWKSRCQPVGDGDVKDVENMCVYPEKIGGNLVIPKCMKMITARDVIKAIEMYYDGGVLEYNK